MMGFSMTTVILLIDRASTGEYPDGIAREVIELFVAKSQAKDNLTSSELKAKLNEMSIKDGDNHEVLADG